MIPQWVGKIPWRRKWQPIPVFLPGKSHGQRSLADTVHGVAQSCMTLCDPLDCSTPGFPVHHQLLESTQTHVHRVSDAIQPSHPLSSPSPLASIFPNVRVVSYESVLCIRWAKYFIRGTSFSHPGKGSIEVSGIPIFSHTSVFLSSLFALRNP